MSTRQTSTLQHMRFTLWALFLIVAVVVMILHTTRVTGSSVPAESTINLSTAAALPLQGPLQVVNNVRGNQTNPRVECGPASYACDDFGRANADHAIPMVATT